MMELLAKLYTLSKSHDLAHLVGDALTKNNIIGDGEIKAKFQNQMMLAVYRYEKINYELGRLREAMNEAKIPFIPLKGSVIRQYYPKPWMRTSCDIDILVHESDLERAVAILVDKLAYKRESKGSHDISLFSDYGVHLELHYMKWCMRHWSITASRRLSLPYRSCHPRKRKNCTKSTSLSVAKSRYMITRPCSRRVKLSATFENSMWKNCCSVSRSW